MNSLLNVFSLVVLLIATCHAQNHKTADFVPEGYKVFHEYFGDLNKDGQDDCVLIIKRVDEKNIVVNRFDQKVDRNRRGIIILFKEGDSYQLADKNYDCFLSENEDGGVYFPPELSIEFKRGNLIVHYAHGRYGYWSYTFRYQDASFKLIGYDSSENRGPVINSQLSINFLTKKKLVRKNINENAEGEDEVFKETWHGIEIENLIELAKIKDFDELYMYKY